MIEQFDIKQYVEFNAKGRAICPACHQSKGSGHRKLNLSLHESGAYHCFAGCSPEDIRAALGVRKETIVPVALAQSKSPAGTSTVTVSPQRVKEAHNRLMASHVAAKAWLNQRGITDELIARHRLGIVRSKVGDRHLPAISIPIPNADGTAYYQKKRIAPWLPESDRPDEYQPWSQKGIPARVWFTWLPAEATQTWLCEGEWDAILLSWYARQAELPVAIASFTCGCGTIPPEDQLALLPGEVVIFYDRNDKPLKNGDRPGEVGAKKLAERLGGRGKVALVPMPDDCQVNGWDVSDALNHGFTLAEFQRAAGEATTIAPQPKGKDNPLRSRLVWNDDLLDRAPDYTEWLVHELLTQDELFLLAAGPRAGKSLLAMTLSKAVAEGSEFLGRPVTQGTVIYVCLEDGDAKLKEREIAQGWSRGLPVAWLQKFKLSELPHLKELAEELDPRLIVLDTLSRIKDGNINESSAEMSQYLEPLQEMAKQLGCCVLLVHHTGKVNVDNANAIDVFDTIRGSSAIRAVCRGTMIIAAGDKNYRLMVENGWGKHDLNVVLDANTWTWKLLGQWKPGSINYTQKDQIVEYLKQVGVATLDQIHEATQIPRKSLYEQLARLQLVENPEEKVVKEGERRRYTYRLALFNTIQQLNKVLNSANPEPDDDRGDIQQKNIVSTSSDEVIISSSSDHPTNAKDDHLIDPVPLHTLLNREEKQPSNVGAEGDSAYSTPIQQAIIEVNPNADTEDNPAYSTLIQHFSNEVITERCRVEILVGQFAGRHASVRKVDPDGTCWVRARQWVVDRAYPPSDLRLLTSPDAKK